MYFQDASDGDEAEDQYAGGVEDVGMDEDGDEDEDQYVGMDEEE